MSDLDPIYRRELEEQHREIVKRAKSDFEDEMLAEDAEWVKEHRLTYLKDELALIDHKIELYQKRAAECDNEVFQWFGDLIREEYIPELISKRKKLLYKINGWETAKPEESVNGITDSDIESARSADCENFIDIKRRDGKHAWANCPFHDEKTPSFRCYPGEKGFYCFGCHVGGNAIDLVMKLHNIGFVEAVKLINRKI